MTNPNTLAAGPLVEHTARLKVDGLIAGEELRVRLDSADPATRTVHFSMVS